MIPFLLRRAAVAALLVFLVLTLVFFAVHAAPGEPAVLYEDEQMSSAQRQALRENLGLDRPVVTQYRLWLESAVRGRWGYSFRQQRPVARVLFEALPATLLLTGTAFLLQYLFGILLGVLAARRVGSFADHAIRVIGLVLYAVPQFWLGMMALLALAYRLPLFPPGQVQEVGTDHLGTLASWADTAYHLVLPATVLAAGTAGYLSRYVRNHLLDTLDEDFIRAARARGLPEWRVVWIHALRNALTPVTQLAGLSVPYLFSGALVVEVVFSWPGMGRLTFQAISGRDYPLILGATALTAVVVVFGSLLADLLQAALDPRVRDHLTASPETTAWHG